MEASPQILSPGSSGRTSNVSSSSEFEFWKARDPFSPQPDLVSADELFVDGILLPLLHLNHDPLDSQIPPSEPPINQEPPELEPGSELESSLPESSTAASTVSKRWKSIFNKGKAVARKNSGSNANKEDKGKGKKKEKKGGVRGNGLSSAELNINIWPFTRSRSDGNGGNRPRLAPSASRKVNSAPCSRSNSASDSKSRKLPFSPSRGGVQLSRSSLVWQVRRGALTGKSSELVVQNAERAVKNEGNETRRSKPAVAVAGISAKAHVRNINVPQLNCSSDEDRTTVGGDGGAASNSVGVGSGDGGRGSNNSFNIRSLFNKKVY